MYSGTPYPVGLDPIWLLTKNKILFTNSMKMKFSIIIGIMQMFFGLCLALLNHVHFGRRVSLLFEFIPQMVFLSFVFGYLCVMIFIKWIKYSGAPSDTTGPGCAPNILIELIQMFFLGTSATSDCQVLYPSQVCWFQVNKEDYFSIGSLVCYPYPIFIG